MLPHATARAPEATLLVLPRDSVPDADVYDPSHITRNPVLASRCERVKPGLPTFWVDLAP